MPEYLNFISIDFWHIVMSMGNLLILTAIIKKFLFKPVQDILKKRENQVASFYLDAKNTLSDAQNDKKIYQEKLQKANHEASNIINSAIKKADSSSKLLLNNTNEQISNLFKKSEKEIEFKKNQALLELKDEIASIVINLAEEVIKREIDPDAHKHLISSAIDNLYEG